MQHALAVACGVITRSFVRKGFLRTIRERISATGCTQIWRSLIFWSNPIKCPLFDAWSLSWNSCGKEQWHSLSFRQHILWFDILNLWLDYKSYLLHDWLFPSSFFSVFLCVPCNWIVIYFLIHVWNWWVTNTYWALFESKNYLFVRSCYIDRPKVTNITFLSCHKNPYPQGGGIAQLSKHLRITVL